VASAAIPHRVASGPDATAAAALMRATQRRSRSGASRGSERITSLAAATKAAEAKMKDMKARRKASSGKPSLLGQHVKKGHHTAAKMRKVFEKAVPGVVQTAEALRRKGVTITSTLTTTFVGYDTDARRAQLQLPPLQGTDIQKEKCKRLGWALIGLYFDIATGEDVKYNEGCSEEDLWMTGIGYEDASGNEKCEKVRRTPDMEFDWGASQTFYTAPCWTSSEFTDYCSASDSAKCTLNGTKGTGTATSGTKSWYVAGNANTGGKGVCTLGPLTCVYASSRRAITSLDAARACPSAVRKCACHGLSCACLPFLSHGADQTCVPLTCMTHDHAHRTLRFLQTSRECSVGVPRTDPCECLTRGCDSDSHTRQAPCLAPLERLERESVCVCCLLVLL